MGGKAKPTKHTAKEIKGKFIQATQNAGGGSAGLKDRLGGATGHAKFQCYVCGQGAPDLKSMNAHHDSKHAKLPWDETKYVDMIALNGGKTTTGIAVKGSIYKKKE